MARRARSKSSLSVFWARSLPPTRTRGRHSSARTGIGARARDPCHGTELTADQLIRLFAGRYSLGWDLLGLGAWAVAFLAAAARVSRWESA